MVGAKSGKLLAQVKKIDVDSPTNPIIDNTVRIHAYNRVGDSGGPVFDYTTSNQYQGLMSSTQGYNVYVISWSHVKAGLGVQ